MSMEGLYHDDADTVDLPVLYVLIKIEKEKGKSNHEVSEALDCPLKTVEEGIAFNKNLYS